MTEKLPPAEQTRETLFSPGFTSRLNIIADMLLVVLATAVAYAWRYGPHDAEANARTLVWVSASLVSTWVVTAAALRHYASFAYDRTLLDEAAMIAIQTSAAITVLALLDLLAPAGTALPRIPHMLIVLWSAAMLLRVAVFRQFANKEKPVENVLIVGVGPIARLTAQDLRQRRRQVITGHLQFAPETVKDVELLKRSYGASSPVEIFGNASDVETVLRKHPVDEVYIAGNVRKHGDEMQEAIRVCEKFGVPFALPAYAFRLERAQAIDGSAVSDGYLHYQTVRPQPFQLSMKRLFDIVTSGIALWLLLPLLLVVIALIKLTSRGPVFFRQKRVGLHGREFAMLKFRSMVVNAEALKESLAKVNEQTGPVFKMRNDPRVTSIGRFIRKYSIDELPQLVNVLRGDMSIVGPRPPVAKEVAQYDAWQRRRLSVRPGLTCIWQVSGRNQISFEDWMYLDMQYIDHWSLLRDFNLIFRTVPIVITGRGAS
jgi:exopolysaccharide biosynthesis polyprenyl glycosylphosphotransferase